MMVFLIKRKKSSKNAKTEGLYQRYNSRMDWKKRKGKKPINCKDNSGTIKRPKKSVVRNGGQTIQRSNFSRRSYDYTQRGDNSRATPAATSADRMIYFRIPKKTSKWLESSSGKHTNNVSRGTSCLKVYLGKLESNYSGRMGLVSDQRRVHTRISPKTLCLWGWKEF